MAVEHAACVEMVFRELSPVKEGLSGPQVEFRVGLGKAAKPQDAAEAEEDPSH